MCMHFWTTVLSLSISWTGTCKIGMYPTIVRSELMLWIDWLNTDQVIGISSLFLFKWNAGASSLAYALQDWFSKSEALKTYKATACEYGSYDFPFIIVVS